MKCPKCGSNVSGRFCSSCGTPLDRAACTRCGASLDRNARFCTQCGHAAGSPAARAGRLPWIIAVAAVLVATVVILLSALQDREPGATGPMQAPFAGAGEGGPGVLSGTPREQADRLFDRIMQERSAGNEDQARFFTPMAIQAYQAAEPLDNDGYYHLSLIHTVAGDYESARRVAQQVLSQNPNHLLALAALAEAATAAGDTSGAREAWQRFLDNLAAERARQLPEYQAHERIFPEYQATARSVVGG